MLFNEQILKNIHYYIYVFTVYSFIGWSLESPFHSFYEKKFVNRGFLYGPFCPIYGVGCMLLIKFLSPLKHNLIILFVTSVVVASTLEYFSGIAMEKLFDSKWWDYSDNKFNFQGRICLQYSLFWGLGSVFVIKVLHPFVKKMLNMIPLQYSIYICLIIIIYFIIDSIFTLISVIQLKNYLEQLSQLSSEIREKLGNMTAIAIDKVGDIKNSAADKASELRSSASNKVDGLKTSATEKVDVIKNSASNKVTEFEKAAQDLKSKYENLLHKATSSSARLIRAFPDLTSKKFNQSIKDIKKSINKNFKNPR